MVYMNNKGADQPAHPRSLISTFVVRFLDSMICILALSKVSRFQLVPVAEQAGLNLTWSKILEDTLSRDVAHIMIIKLNNLLQSTGNTFSSKSGKMQPQVLDQSNTHFSQQEVHLYLITSAF